MTSNFERYKPLTPIQLGLFGPNRNISVRTQTKKSTCMSGTGGRDTGGNGPVVATGIGVGQPGVVATGGATSGSGVVTTGTGTGKGVDATGTGGAAVLATNAGTAEALRLVGDTASTTAACATFFVSPLQNQPSGAHAIGHMYVTAAGKLMICTSAGTPGTWTVVGSQS